MCVVVCTIVVFVLLLLVVVVVFECRGCSFIVVVFGMSCLGGCVFVLLSVLSDVDSHYDCGVWLCVVCVCMWLSRLLICMYVCMYVVVVVVGVVVVLLSLWLLLLGCCL